MKKSKLLNAPPPPGERLEEGMTTKKLANAPSMGIMKGIVKMAIKMPSGKGVIIITEEDSYLELKVFTLLIVLHSVK